MSETTRGVITWAVVAILIFVSGVLEPGLAETITIIVAAIAAAFGIKDIRKLVGEGKPAAKSKTVWGGITFALGTALPSVLTLIGLPAEVIGIVPTILQAVGSLLTGGGLIDALRKLKGG